MQIVCSPSAMQCLALEMKRKGKTIGLVPTMGSLHEGHLSLMHLIRNRCDVLAISIFVNPAQFGPDEDWGVYPRAFERDARLCKQEGADIIFHPEPEGMYASNASTWVHEEALSSVLCGILRPGHFRGVCTVAAKLFNLILPDLAAFGEKDAQQLRIIERMTQDLNFPVKIIRGPIVREPDGLAMSSRNRYLSPIQRENARSLKHALDRIAEKAENGEHRIAVLGKIITDIFSSVPGAKIDYIGFVDEETLRPVARIQKETLVALAVKFGKVRLIDNIILNA